MAITKVINDLIDLNQTGDDSGIRLPAGTTADRTETFTTDYLVVAGGAGGARTYAGGGGAGGLRTSYNNSTTTTNSLSFPSGKTAIATYMLNGDATDVSTNYNGAESSITYVAGEYGGAASFNGSSSYIQTTLTKPAGTAFSFSCWINTPGGVAQHIVGDYNSSIANPTFRIQIPANNTLSVGVGTGTGAVSYVSFPTISGLANTWKNLIITVDGTSVNAYINGVALGTTQTSAQTLGAGAQPYTLGAYRPAAGYQNFSGSIDQVRIYDSALSGTDASNIYSNEVQANSGGGSAAESSLALSPGISYNVTVGQGGAGVTGNNVSGSGANGQNSIFSVITSNGGGGGGDYLNNSPGVQNGGSGGGGGAEDAGGVSGNGTINQGYDGGVGSTTGIYRGGGGGGAGGVGIDGNTSGNGGNALSINIIGSATAYAGGGGGGLWSASSGNAGSGGSNIGGDGAKGAVNAGNGTNNTGSGGGSAGGVGSGFNGGGNAGDGSSGVVILRYPTASVSSFTTTGTLNTPSTTDTLASATYPITNTAYYKLDGDAADSSGNGNNGADSNVTWANGRFDQAAVFNGSSSIISIPNLKSVLDNNFSVSFWWKPELMNTFQVPVGGLYNEAGGAAYGWMIYQGSDNKMYLYWIISISPNTSNAFSNNTVLTQGSWYHIVATKSSTGAALYVNKADAASSPSAGSVWNIEYNTNPDFYFGKRNISNNYANGELDQVRLYDNILTQANVDDLYNEHYQTKFTDGSDTAIAFTEGTGTISFTGTNPTPPSGAIRYNTTTKTIEFYNGAWVETATS